MGMKKHSLSIIRAELQKQADLFLVTPSSSQYLVLQACMNAYQFVFQLEEAAVIAALAGKASHQIPMIFAKMHDDDIADLDRQIAAGGARVIEWPIK